VRFGGIGNQTCRHAHRIGTSIHPGCQMTDSGLQKLAFFLLVLLIVYVAVAGGG